MDDKELQRRTQRIGALVQEIEEFSDPVARAKAKELIQAVMDLHGSGLEQVMEIIFRAGEPGTRIIDDLGNDPLVSSLLVLYGLHPQELATRVDRAIDCLNAQLRAQSCKVDLVSISSGDVRVRVAAGPHTCGSSSRQLQATVEEVIRGAAPDLSSLAIDGLDGLAASGFVSLDKLLASPPSPGVMSRCSSTAARGDSAD